MIPNIKNENDLRKLAGLSLREAGAHLDDIVEKHADAMSSVMNGETSLYDHQEFFDELYDYFVNSGEMPYGIAKARDGDPDQWIQEYLESEYGSEWEQGHDSMDGDFDSGMASAGHGTDEDYGYYGESSDMKRLAKVVADGNRSVQMLTESEVKEEVIQPTGLQAYINKLIEENNVDESMWVGGSGKRPGAGKKGGSGFKYRKRKAPSPSAGIKGGPKTGPTAKVSLAGGGLSP